MAMKGLSLPINMIVIVAIAVLVLVVIAAFFTGQTGSGLSQIEKQSAFSNTCNTLRSVHGCNPQAIIGQNINSNLQNPNTNQPFSMRELCIEQGINPFNDVQCARLCGCPV